jgi:hypothetical protein
MPKFLVLIALTFVSLLALAQPGDPGGDPDVPIGGIAVLLGAGAFLGLKKLADNRRKP